MKLLLLIRALSLSLPLYFRFFDSKNLTFDMFSSFWHMLIVSLHMLFRTEQVVKHGEKRPDDEVQAFE